MRYLKNRQTGAVELVDDNDDARFYELLAQRDDMRRQIWEQTGPQDPDVQAIEVPGQEPANADATSTASLNRLDVPTLQGMADERGLTVEGTGKDGRVLKGDLVNALSAA